MRWGKRRASEGKYKEERQKGINSCQGGGKALGQQELRELEVDGLFLPNLVQWLCILQEPVQMLW